MSNNGSNRGRRGGGGFLGNLVSNLADVVSSAGELLVDPELRRKGAKFIVQEASRGINEAQRGLEAGADALGRSIQQGAKARFGAGARQLQSVLRNIERQIQDFQRQQQQQDLQSELDHHHKLPVDIQIGDQVFEDMPQEMRSRFWYVLLERPDLAQQLLKKSASRETTPAAAGSSGSSNNPSASPVSAQAEDQHGQPEALSQTAAGATPSTGSPFAPYSRSDRPAVAVPAAEAAGGAGGGETVEGVGVAGGASGPSGSNTSISTSTSSGGSGATGPRLEAPADSVPDIDNVPLQQATSTAAAATDAGTLAASSLAAAGAGGGGSSSTSLPAAEAAASAAASQAAEAAAAAVIPRAPSPWTSGHNVTSVDPRVSLSAALASGSASGAAGTAAAAVGDGNDPFLATISNPVAPSPWQLAAAAGPEASAPAPAAAGAGAAAAAVEASASASRTETADAGNTNAAAVAGGSSNGASVGADPAAAATTPAPTTSSGGAAAAVAAAPAASGGDGDGWEMVSRDVPSSGKAAGGGSSSEAEALDTVRTLVESMAEDASLDGQRASKQAVFQAMLEVPWVAGEGVPDSPIDGTPYAELLEAGCGSIEDVIVRDVPRTFPEHPLFNTPAGQQKLLRVLKAYAAADPEVGYCQGMAFAAGVLLMYLPEEPAFRLFQRLMSPEGPNLRRYYLPGLDHLKLELSCFELLLSSHHPQLHQHLLDAGLPALLYAAQWLMTTYSCPFPIHVAARVLDVLLQSDSDAMLPRFGLAVMDALSGKLLELQDFEELITYLKVKPLSWPLHTHRKVFTAALTTTASDAELQAAAAAAREEFARSGRVASFSNRYLARQATAGGTTRLELAPGPMGPKSLAATEAAAAMAVAAADGGGDGSSSSRAEGTGGGEMAGSEEGAAGGASGGGGGGGGGVGSVGPGEAGSSSSGQQQQTGQRELSGGLPCTLSSSPHDAVLVGPASSGIVVDELDALEDLITDLDLLLPGGAGGSETDSELGSPAAAACAAVGGPVQQPM